MAIIRVTAYPHGPPYGFKPSIRFTTIVNDAPTTIALIRPEVVVVVM